MESAETRVAAKSLITVHVDVDTARLRAYFGRGGVFWRGAVRLALELILCVAVCAVQNVLPESYAELPLYPAVVVVAYLAGRRAPWHAFGMALFCGLLLDCGNWGRLGSSSLLFVLEVLCVRLLQPRVEGFGYLLSTMLVGCVSAFVWIGCRLFLFSQGMAWASCMRLAPQVLLCGGLLTGILFAPMLFALLDLLPNIFRERYVPQEGS